MDAYVASSVSATNRTAAILPTVSLTTLVLSIRPLTPGPAGAPIPIELL